jgi:VWFA-related protein
MLLAFVLSLSVFASIRSQQQGKQEEVVRVTTNLVQVDVVVTDKTGQQVTDLRPEDFEISEDRKQQQITHFSYIMADGRAAVATDSSAKNPASVQPANLSREQTQRTIAIVVDDLGLSAESIVSVKEALRKFVSEQMQPNDQVAIIRTSRGIGALQQFSSDKPRLMAAIDRLRWFPAGRGGTSPFAPVDTQQQEDATQGAQILNELEEQRAAKYAVGTIGTLGFVVRGLSELPGRKAIMLIAESFRLFTTQGRNVQLIDTLRRVTDEANLASTVIYTIDASGLNPLNLTAEDRVSGPAYTFDPRTLPALGPTTSAPLNRSTPRRNDVPPTAASIAQEEGGSSAAFKRLDALMAQRDNQNVQTQSVLSYLAQRTGGLFTANTNNLSLGTQRMLEDQQGYYLLGYRPSESIIDPTTGRRRYHDLSVKVKRSGLRVRSRAGYYGVATEAGNTKRTNAQQMAAALTSPFNAGGVGLRVTPLFFNDQTAGSYVRALLHINGADLTFKEQPDGSRKTLLDIAAVNFDEAGQVVDQFTDTQDIDVGRDAYQGLLQNGLSFVLNVPVKKPGAYQLRVAVRDVSSERIGSAGQFIEIPNLSKNTLSLSGIVLSGINQNPVGNVPAVKPGPAAPPVQQDAGNPRKAAVDDPSMQATPTVRRLRQGMILSYGYTIYNAQLKGTGGPQLQTQMILFREGKQVFAGKISEYDPGKQTDIKRLKVNGGLRIGSELTPGEYVLQVVVTDKLKDMPNTATQSLDFEVVN